MIIPLPLNYEIQLRLRKNYVREGICSNVEFNDKHILLWDFDNIDVGTVELALKIMQAQYNLPSIIIAKSSDNGIHAYCFCARPFLEIMHIISGTPNIDEHYVRIGALRGYFTLRISSRNNKAIKPIKILHSAYPNEINPLDITVNKYLTLNKGV